MRDAANISTKVRTYTNHLYFYEAILELKRVRHVRLQNRYDAIKSNSRNI